MRRFSWAPMILREIECSISLLSVKITRQKSPSSLLLNFKTQRDKTLILFTIDNSLASFGKYIEVNSAKITAKLSDTNLLPCSGSKPYSDCFVCEEKIQSQVGLLELLYELCLIANK